MTTDLKFAERQLYACAALGEVLQRLGDRIQAVRQREAEVGGEVVASNAHEVPGRIEDWKSSHSLRMWSGGIFSRV